MHVATDSIRGVDILERSASPSDSWALVLLVVQFMIQIKFNFNNFIFYGGSDTAWQRVSGIRRRR